MVCAHGRGNTQIRSKLRTPKQQKNTKQQERNGSKTRRRTPRVEKGGDSPSGQ